MMATVRDPRKLALDREFMAAAAAMAEMGIAQKVCAIGDIEGRRQGLKEMFGIIGKMLPAMPDVTQTKHTVPTPDGSTIALIEFRKGPRPQTAEPVIYHIHGGGMIAGSIDEFAPFLAVKVGQSGLTHFSIDYRLAPEHKHPIPINDAYAGLQWLSEHAAELGVDPARIIVSGESAGGGLAAGTVLMARDKKLSPPIAAQQLIYPMLDDRNQTPFPEIEPFATWKNADNITGWGALLGNASGSEGEVEGHEYAAPARAGDLKGLPPTYIDVGQLDIFAPEDILFSQRLVKFGVPTEFHLYPGLPHGFESAGENVQLVKQAMANRSRWLAEFVQ